MATEPPEPDLAPPPPAGTAAAAEADARSEKNRRVVKGVAAGIGSAAIVAALLYANRPKPANKA